MKPRGLKKVLDRRRQNRQKGSKKAKICPVVWLVRHSSSWFRQHLRPIELGCEWFFEVCRPSIHQGQKIFRQISFLDQATQFIFRKT